MYTNSNGASPEESKHYNHLHRHQHYSNNSSDPSAPSGPNYKLTRTTKLTYSCNTLYFTQDITAFSSLHSMKKTQISFTMSLSKRPDVAGNPKQAFVHGENATSYMLGAIVANTLAAIGFVSQDKKVQYIYAPHVHRDLSGKPLSIVGNASNKAGECSLVTLDIASIGIFHSLMKKGADLHIIDHYPLPPELLAGTPYKNITTKYVFVTVPNVHFLYYGQDPPKGLIASEDTKLAFSLLGKGYDAWSHFASISLSKDKTIDTIITKATDVSAPNKAYEAYTFNKSKQYGVKLLRDNSLTTATLVDSNDYPTIANNIRAIYTPTIPTTQVNPATTTVTVTSPSDMGKDEEAQKGLVKFLLFSLCGDVNFETRTINYIVFIFF